jgi:hypothetical protein
MSTPWEDDVAEALRCAHAGRCENWPLVARTLAAEVAELRTKVQLGMATLADLQASVPDPGYDTEVPNGV